MQHNTFLWWLAATGLAGGAGMAACWSMAVARHYARLLRGGACPDGKTLGQAVARATCLAGGGIIRFRRLWWAGMFGEPVFWTGTFVGVGLACSQGSMVQMASLAIACLALVLLGSIDRHIGLLPDALTQPLLWSGLLMAWMQGGEVLTVAFSGAFVGYAVPACLRLMWLWWRRLDALGQGDVKLLAGIGVWVGPHDVLLVLLFACLAAIVWAGLRYRYLALRASYPFGPFLSCSAIVWLLWPGVSSVVQFETVF